VEDYYENYRKTISASKYAVTVLGLSDKSLFTKFKLDYDKGIYTDLKRPNVKRVRVSRFAAVEEKLREYVRQQKQVTGDGKRSAGATYGALHLQALNFAEECLSFELAKEFKASPGYIHDVLRRSEDVERYKSNPKVDRKQTASAAVAKAGLSGMSKSADTKAQRLSYTIAEKLRWVEEYEKKHATMSASAYAKNVLGLKDRSVFTKFKADHDNGLYKDASQQDARRRRSRAADIDPMNSCATPN
jgi:hypothetical protein